MSVVVVVQARMGSSRLPGKVLMDLGGRPMLRFMLDRLRSLDAPVVVATSDRIGDDAVVACATAAGVAVVRGDETDVLARFGRVLQEHPADHVVRLTADCPIVDPALVAEVVGLHLETGAAYTSNTIIRTHPDGLDVEVITADALREADAGATDTIEREHVTPYLYRRPQRHRLAALVADERWGHLRWTVDTGDDIEVVRTMVAEVGAGASWSTVLGSLPPERRARLVDGFEPARPGDGHPDLDSVRVDDPAARLLTFYVEGRPVGWLRLTITDVGTATMSGSIRPADLDAARAALPAFLAQSQQVLTLRGEP